MTTFIFCHPDANRFIANLLTWLKAGYVIQDLLCLTDEPCLKTPMQQLLVSPRQLRDLCVNATTNATIACLPSFTGLVHCHLQAAANVKLDLQPMAACVSLTSLVLEDGVFHKLPLATPDLCIAQANVTCLDDSFHLRAERPQCAFRFRSQVAWQWLRSLHLADEIAIEPVNGQGHILYQRYEIGQIPPQSLSRLVSLKRLTTTLRGSSATLERLTVFSSLTRLHLLPAEGGTISNNEVGLSRLQMLLITPLQHKEAQQPLDYMFRPAISFVSFWGQFKSLRSVEITGPVVFDSSILEIAKLFWLNKFHLISYKPGNVETAQHVARLQELFTLTHRCHWMWSWTPVDVLIDELDHQVLPDGVLDSI